MVVTVEIDVHKQTHCAVAVDEGGRPLGKPVTVRATDAGHRQLLRWARREFVDGVTFAVEDCRHVSGRLERALLDAGGGGTSPAEVDGPDPHRCPHLGQVRSDRCPGHRAARLRPVDRGQAP